MSSFELNGFITAALNIKPRPATVYLEQTDEIHIIQITRGRIRNTAHFCQSAIDIAELYFKAADDMEHMFLRHAKTGETIYPEPPRASGLPVSRFCHKHRVKLPPRVIIQHSLEVEQNLASPDPDAMATGIVRWCMAYAQLLQGTYDIITHSIDPQSLENHEKLHNYVRNLF